MCGKSTGCNCSSSPEHHDGDHDHDHHDHNNHQHKHVYAVCGKGGTGKTAFTAMLAKALMESHHSQGLLLIDADPALGLTNALGLNVKKTLGQVRESIIEMAKNGDSSEKKELVDSLDYMIMESLIEENGFSLIAMGRSESQGCFCPVNNLLRDSIEILSKKFHTILIDGEAGLEQINRQIVSELDCIITLTDGSVRGLQTVEVLKSMIEDNHIVKAKKIGVVFNRAVSSDSVLLDSAKKINVDVLGIIPYSLDVAEYDAKGTSLKDLPTENAAYTCIKEILKKI